MRSWKLVRRSIGLLNRRDKAVLILATAAQASTALLDLLAVVILGLVATRVASVSGASPTSSLGLSPHLDFVQELPLLLTAAVAGALLVAKSFIGLWLTRRTLKFIANRQAIVAGGLSERLLTGSILDLQKRSSQQTSFALTYGADAATSGILGPATVIAAELSLIVLLAVGLLVIDPLVALFAAAFFGLVAVTLQLSVGSWVQRLGERNRHAEVASIETLQHSFRAYRELTVTGRRALFIDRFIGSRWRAAAVKADLYTVNQLGKYVFEIGLVVGGGLLVLLLSTTRGLAESLAVLTVFLVVASRIVPSLLRLQSAFASIRTSAGTAELTFALADELNQRNSDSTSDSELDRDAERFNQLIQDGYPGFSPAVALSHVSLIYPDSSRPALKDITVSIEPGQSLAIVGPTGSGKSTLSDVILGVLDPTSGSATISGLPARAAIAKWPGAMAYVPQDVAVLSGTVRSNVALGIHDDYVDDDAVWRALEQARLDSYLAAMRDGLDTVVGEDGVHLSGGQRQRLGLARALYSRPQLLVLDEATSALDAETERNVAQTISEIAGNVTVIVVAHRLATVRDSDVVIYLDDGEIIASGTFEQVRAAAPDFDRQAKLLGL